MSPTAHSRSPARIRSSVSSARASGSRPTVSSPMSAEVRLAADGHQQLRPRSPTRRRPRDEPAVVLAPASTSDARPAPRRPRRAAPASSDLGAPPAPRDRAAGPRPPPASPGPEARERLRQLAPDRLRRRAPPASPGARPDLHDVAVGPVRRAGEPVDRRDRRLGAGVEHDAAPRVVRRVRRPRPCRVRRAGRVRGRIRTRPPRAARPRRRRASRRWPRGSGRPPASSRASPSPRRPGVERRASPSASAARIIIFDGMQP